MIDKDHKNIALAPIELTPVETSRDFLLVILFAKSTSKSFHLTLKLATKASHFAEGILEGKTHYLVGINKNNEDLILAKSILDYVSKWTGTRVYVSGNEHRSAYQVMMVIDCISKALKCNDPKAHCYVIADHPLIGRMKSDVAWDMPITLSGIDPRWKELKKAPKLLFPCRYIQPYYDTIQHGHPSSPQDQIQAAAVRHGCHWCPLFDASQIEIIEKE